MLSSTQFGKDGSHASSVAAAKHSRALTFHPKRTSMKSVSANTRSKRRGREVPPGALLIGSGEGEHSSLFPYRSCDLQTHRQAVEGEAGCGPMW